MDAFFASVEEMIRPGLRGRPLAVGGAPGTRHGVVSTASYAARPFGVFSGMPIAKAKRLCPSLICIPADHEKYLYFSLELLRVLEKFSPAVEPTSVDEAFLDLSGLARHWPDPLAFAERLQQAIRDRVGVTASIGIGPTKMIAKIASGLHKPSGITLLTLDGYRRLVGELPVRALWGVGPASEKALERLGFHRVRDLADADPIRLRDRFGVFGLWIHASARGELDDPVVPYWKAPEAKSFGHETTLAENVSDPRVMRRVIRGLAGRVARRVRKKGKSGRTVTLKVRFPDFETTLRSLTLPEPIDDGGEIARAAAFLMERVPFRGRSARLLGVSLSGIAPGHAGAQEHSFEDRGRRRRLLGAVDRIRDRWGDAVIEGG
jgi:DNA polymerase-4